MCQARFSAGVPSSLILSLCNGTTALMSLANSLAWMASAGPVHILATLWIFIFRAFVFLLSCSIFLLLLPGDRFSFSGIWRSWTPLPRDLVFWAIGVVSTRGGINYPPASQGVGGGPVSIVIYIDYLFLQNLLLGGFTGCLRGNPPQTLRWWK